MSPETIAKEFLKNGRVMQLAIMSGDQPRVSSVYYVASDDGTAIYWLSEETRRHSKDLINNPKVGGAIVVKDSTPVIGLQFIGRAEKVSNDIEQKEILDMYNKKYDDVAKYLYERIQKGVNRHALYRLDIDVLELFDEVNFSNESPLAISLK